jgi:hypothetical protein
MHEDVSDELVAVQTELGTNPSGSEATVAARLDSYEEAYTSYSPTLTGSSSNPSGHSTTGRSLKIGRRVTGNAQFTMAAGVGTGTYRMTLPYTADSTYYGFTVGTVRTNNSGSAGGNGWVVVSDDGTYVFLENAAGAPFTETVPFTWGTGDFARITFDYYSAS